MRAARQRLRDCVAIVFIAAAGCSSAPEPAIRAVTGVAQGTTYSLQWFGGGTQAQIAAAAAQELERLDALLSNYRPDSALEKFNAARTTQPIELPRELVELLELAQRVHAASDGCFDPTVRPLVRAWGFDGDAPAVPDAAALDAARSIVGLQRLQLLDASHARKAIPELEVDMSSIGQGYTAGRLARLLERHGSTAYLAEIGGEIVARGTKADGSPWRVGIEDPGGGSAPPPALRISRAAPTAVVTSGSYRHFLDADGRRFGHIIDPRSGAPVEHALLSVTVVGPDAAAAAAWGTALLCLGPAAAASTADRENLAALLWTGERGAPPALAQSRAFAAEWRAMLDEPAAPR